MRRIYICRAHALIINNLARIILQHWGSRRRGRFGRGEVGIMSSILCRVFSVFLFLFLREREDQVLQMLDAVLDVRGIR